jgi:hypothetical protein
MPAKQLIPWTDLEARTKAILDLLKRVQGDAELRRHCLSSPDYVRQIFIDMYQLDVPASAILSFVPEGDLDTGKGPNKGSLVLEVPPDGTINPGDLIDYVRCTYIEWTKEKELRRRLGLPELG